GALFGLLTGTVIISFASSIGATLACFVSRYLLRDWVQKKFGDRLSVIDRGITEDGAFYLFTLRLIPVFPFFVINLLMGLTKMPLKTFYWVSQLGMLAGTVVYVNAGKELGKIDSLKGILSPGLIISFVLLGLFPIVTKKLMGWHRKRQ
ncbi:MAG: TVP38/TMEM64 family protein, partial [Nitrospirota bacterium]|nr:TVP38/TMEM64 family protein [Nitrospirota bacterium]